MGGTALLGLVVGGDAALLFADDKQVMVKSDITLVTVTAASLPDDDLRSLAQDVVP